MSKIAKFFWFILAFWAVLALSVLAASVAAMLPSVPGGETSELGIVRIEGVIMDASQVLEGRFQSPSATGFPVNIDRYISPAV